jgi:RND family efflux transporter MFP subunit
MDVKMSTSFLWRPMAGVRMPGLFPLLALAAWSLSTASPAKPGPQEPLAPKTLAIEVSGRIQCILTRKCTIAPVPLHPVVAVMVEPGNRVKKGQVLVKLDDDEPQADVRIKQAILENATIALTEAQRTLAAAEAVFQKGALPEQRCHEIRVAALKAAKDAQAAQAALDSAKAELEHYEVTAQIDGVVSWLKVHPGMVSRPGTTTWGEILDLRKVDIRCELTWEQVDRVAVGQTVEVRKKGKPEVFGTGRVVFVGISAATTTDLVPIHVRLSNPEERLRCDEPVQVRFTTDASAVNGVK